MADTFEPLLNLRLQQTGNNQNTWGDLLNSDTIVPIATAIAGRTSHDLTGLSTLDLSGGGTGPGLLAQMQVFTGTLTSDCVVTVPNLSKRMLIVNNTTGSHFVTVKAATGTTLICIPQGTSKDVVTDGSAGIIRMDGKEVGEIKYFGQITVPAGYFAADGSAKSRTGPVDLFNAYNADSLPWGTGNGATTFNIPNLQDTGRFLRSSASGLTVGTYQSNTVGPHGHTASASTSVSLSITSDGNHAHSGTTGGQNSDHSHGIPHGSPDFGISGGALALAMTDHSGGGNTGGTSNDHTHNFNTNAAGTHSHSGSTASGSTSVTVNNNTGTTETRPESAVALACVRY